MTNRTVALSENTRRSLFDNFALVCHGVFVCGCMCECVMLFVPVCLNVRMRSWVDWMDMSTELGFHNSSVTVYRRKHGLKPDSSIDSCVIRQCVKVLCYNCIYKYL